VKNETHVQPASSVHKT